MKSSSLITRLRPIIAYCLILTKGWRREDLSCCRQLFRLKKWEVGGILILSSGKLLANISSLVHLPNLIRLFHILVVFLELLLVVCTWWITTLVQISRYLWVVYCILMMKLMKVNSSNNYRWIFVITSPFGYTRYSK